MLQNEIVEGFNLVSKIDLKNKGYRFMITSIPEIGLVGVLALRQIIKNLRLDHVGFILNDYSSLFLRYEDGNPIPNIRLYDGGSWLILIVEAPVTPSNALGLAKLIYNLYKWTSSETLIMLGSAPSATRQKKALENLLVLAATMGEKVRKVFEENGVEILKNGTLSGPYAYVMNMLMKDEKDAAVILSETYPAPIAVDPESAAKLLLVLSKIINQEIDVRELLERAEEIKLEMRKLEQLAAATPTKEVGQLYT